MFPKEQGEEFCQGSKNSWAASQAYRKCFELIDIIINDMSEASPMYPGIKYITIYITQYLSNIIYIIQNIIYVIISIGQIHCSSPHSWLEQSFHISHSFCKKLLFLNKLVKRFKLITRHLILPGFGTQNILE